MLRGFTFYFGEGITDIPCTPVFPPGAADLRFTLSRDEEFGYYRRELTTPLTFRGADYDYLLGLDEAGECTELGLNIYLNGVAFFSKTLRIGTPHFAFDLDKCRVTVQGDDVDDYACFLAAFDDEINILTGTDKITVTPFLGTIEETVCSDVLLSDQVGYDNLEPLDGCLTNPETYLLKLHEVIQQDGIGPGGQDQRDYVSTWIREVVVVACSGGSPVPPPGDGWTLIDDNCPTDATYARPLSGGTLYDNTATSTTVDIFYSLTRTVFGLEFEGIEISNGVLLSEILATFLPCDLVTVSDFYNINPDATHPVNDVYTSAGEALQNLVVYQKSDVKRPNAQNDATNGKWTLEGLFSALKAMHDVEYRITGTTFRLEHVSYFEEAEGEDLTTTQPERLAGTNKYSYDSGAQISEEKWRFAENVSEAFEGPPYKYDCFSQRDRRKEEFVINETNNDVGSLLTSPDVYADAGFVFINAHEVSGSYYMTSYVSALTGALLLNGHMSIPNMIRTYQTYNRPRLTGTWDGADVEFDTAQRNKVQDGIRFKVCPEDFAAFDPSALVNTEIGWGRIENAEYSVVSGVVSAELRH